MSSTPKAVRLTSQVIRNDQTKRKAKVPLSVLGECTKAGLEQPEVLEYLKSFGTPSRYLNNFRFDEIPIHLRVVQRLRQTGEPMELVVLRSRSSRDEIKIWIIGGDSPGMLEAFGGVFKQLGISVGDAVICTTKPESIFVWSQHVGRKVILKKFGTFEEFTQRLTESFSKTWADLDVHSVAADDNQKENVRRKSDSSKLRRSKLSQSHKEEGRGADGCSADEHCLRLGFSLKDISERLKARPLLGCGSAVQDEPMEKGTMPHNRVAIVESKRSLGKLKCLPARESAASFEALDTEVCKALSEAVRCAMVGILLQVPNGLSGVEIQHKLTENGMVVHQSKVSKHLSILRQAGLVRSRRAGAAKIFTICRESLERFHSAIGAAIV